MASRCVSRKTAKVILGLSIAILIISIAAIFAFQVFYNKILKEKISLGEGSLVTKIWEDIPLPIYEKLYFFNITNKDAFTEGREPMNVTEVGPYTFKSRWVKNKNDTQWNPNNTVSYRETRTYDFVPELSNGTEDDFVFTLNGPMVIGANVLPSWMLIPFDGYCLYEGEHLVISKTIRELAYEGYDDVIIKYAKKFIHGSPYVDGKFSWLYGKNDSNDGLFTVFTGTDDESKTNFIDKWNGLGKLKFWNNDTCNGLNGTSIETGPPIKGDQNSYTFFQSIFCRSLTFNYLGDVEHYGIPAKRFRPSYELFANSTENPDNHCFEVRNEHASGVLDISRCQFNAPVLISFPHFHMADPSYLENVDGLNPDDEKHGSYVDVEPVTGLSIDLIVRFQLNVEIERLPGFHFFNDIRKGVLPLFWVELSLKIDEDLANFLKESVRVPKIIAYSVFSGLFIAGWVGVVFSLIILCAGSKSEDASPLVINEAKEEHPPMGYGYENEKAIMEEKPKYITKSSSDISFTNPQLPEKKGSNAEKA